MISLGNGQYQITNSQTGEKRVVTADQLPQYGLKAPDTSIPFVSGAVPLLGMLLGSSVGGSAGALTGPAAPILSPAGRIGGAGVGYAGGQVGARYLEDLLAGRQPGGEFNNFGQNVATGSLAELTGLGLAKGAGAAAHPISTVLNADNPLFQGATTILTKSPKTVDIGSILDLFKSDVLPKYTARTLETPAKTAYNQIVPDVVAAAQKVAAPSADIASMNVPIKAANEIKTALNSRGFNAGSENVVADVEKQIARLIKENIQTQEPGVKASNTIAHLLNIPENAVKTLPWLVPGLPYAGRRGLSYAGSAPIKALQALIPQGGGYLNTLLPLLFGAGATATSQQ